MNASTRCFLIPEILDLIFLHFTLYTLRTQARLVCKRWNAVSLRYLYLTTQWTDTLSAEAERQVLDGLCRANALTIYTMDDDAPRHKPARGEIVSWDIRPVREATLQNLLDAIMDLSYAHGQNSEDQKYPSSWFLERVILRGEMGYQSRLYPLLPYLQRLKELRLENISQSIVDLDVILLSCRQLSRLHLETAELAPWERWERWKRVQLRWRSETRTPLTLTSLTIRRLSFGHSTIECLLNDCSQLRNLDILLPMRWSSRSTMPTTNQSAIPGDDINRYAVTQFSIFRILTSACPFLNHLGVSSMNDTMRKYDAEEFVESFPLVQSAALLDTDILDREVNKILFPSIFSNRLSSLEITCFKILPQYMTYNLDDVVHRILCNTPTLLHLKAPRTLYYGEYFDMCGDLDTNGFYSPMLCINRQPAKHGLRLRRHPPPFSRIQKQLWACRGLQTLELTVRGIRGDVRSSECSSKCSRIMFAYLAEVCPDLREIVLRRSSVNLNLEGGLCLLSKLRHLRKLEIHTDMISKLERKDLFWLSTKRVLEKKESSTQEFSRQMALEELRRVAAEEDKHWERNISSASSFRQSTASSVEPKIGTAMSDRYKTLVPDDIVAMTKFSSVVKVLEERMADDRVCWPQLERFGLCTERPGGMHLSTEQIERAIKNVRSDMEIVVKAPLFQP